MSHNTYLKRQRARWCLSQDELADLLGVTQTRVSRYEQNEEYPATTSLLGLQAIFDRAPRTLFPKIYEMVEEAVMGRAAELERSLEGKQDYASTKKRQLLEAMMARATKRDEA
jgi:transcriptional regulator with XRE-family HTH domain